MDTNAFHSLRAGMTISRLLLSLSLSVTEASAAGQLTPCQQSPTQDLLPEVVAPMVGVRPVWLVDGSATWRSGEPVKTLWIFLRTSEEIRIEGRRLDGPGTLKLRHGDDPPAESLLISNPHMFSVIPTGASPEIMRVYAFM